MTPSPDQGRRVAFYPEQDSVCTFAAAKFFDDDIRFDQRSGDHRRNDSSFFGGNAPGRGAIDPSAELDAQSIRDCAAGYALGHGRILRSGHAHTEPGNRPIRAECFVLERLRAKIALVLRARPR